MDVTEREGRRAQVLVAREELVVMEFDMNPRTDGAGPHFHKRHVDSFYVLDGTLEIMVSGDTRHARAGELVHAPPDVVHSFKNSSAGRLRLLNVHAPGMRFDEYLRRMDADEDVDPEEYDTFEID